MHCSVIQYKVAYFLRYTFGILLAFLNHLSNENNSIFVRTILDNWIVIILQKYTNSLNKLLQRSNVILLNCYETEMLNG